MLAVKPARKAGPAWALMPVILVLWGSFAAVSKLTMEGMDSFQLQFLMFGIASIVMTLSLLLRKKLKQTLIMRPREILILLLCGLPSWLYYFLYTLSLKMIPAVEASMLNYLFPVMIVLFAIPINRERLTLPKALSLLLGLAGMLVIMTEGRLSGINLSNIAGDLLALGAAVSWGIFSNLGKWNNHDIEASVYVYVLESFALSTASLFCFSRWLLPGPLPLLGVLWISLSNVVLSVPLWLKVMKSAPAALVASASFITPFVTLLFLLLVPGEHIHLSQGIGLLVIVVAIAVQNIKFAARGSSSVKQTETV